MMRVLASLVKTLEKAMEEVKSYQWECCFEVYVAVLFTLLWGIIVVPK